MPSPIAHSAAGYLVYKLARRKPEDPQKSFGPFPWLLILAVVLSLVPDLDAIPGVLSGNFAQFHNNGTHSLLAGLAFSLAAAGIIRWRVGSGFGYWFGVIFACYGLHVVLDFFTYGRGVMLFWPFQEVRYASPVKLFFGFHWSEGLFSWLHLWTVLNELVFTLLILFATYFWEKKRERSRVERIDNL